MVGLGSGGEVVAYHLGGGRPSGLCGGENGVTGRERERWESLTRRKRSPSERTPLPGKLLQG